jgi:hypothetical protein
MMHSRVMVDVATFVVLVGASFFGIVSADVTWAGAQIYWSGLTIVFAIAAYLLAWMHQTLNFTHGVTLLRIAAHWLGVLIAVHVIFYFVNNNQITEAQAGLTLSVIFALAAYLCGIAFEWRFVLIGAAIGLASVATALVQENLWILLGIALAALVIMIAVDLLRQRQRKVNARSDPSVV